MVWFTISSFAGVDGHRFSVLHWRVTVNKCKIAIVKIARDNIFMLVSQLIYDKPNHIVIEKTLKSL
jgi:hypothetical protein